MPGAYELWDTKTGNCIGAYDSEAAALAAVRAALRMQGQGAVESLALGREDEHGQFKAIAQGADLIARTEATV